MAVRIPPPEVAHQASISVCDEASQRRGCVWDFNVAKMISISVFRGCRAWMCISDCVKGSATTERTASCNAAESPDIDGGFTSACSPGSKVSRSVLAFWVSQSRCANHPRPVIRDGSKNG